MENTNFDKNKYFQTSVWTLSKHFPKITLSCAPKWWLAKIPLFYFWHNVPHHQGVRRDQDFLKKRISRRSNIFFILLFLLHLLEKGSQFSIFGEQIFHFRYGFLNHSCNVFGSSCVLAFLLFFQDVVFSAVLHRRDEESEGAAEEYEYEGCKGIKKQVKDVHSFAASQIGSAATNIGVAYLALGNNLANQTLRGTYKFLDKTRSTLVNGLECVQNFYDASLGAVKGAVRKSGGFLTSGLDSLSNKLDQLEQSVTRRKSRSQEEADLESDSMWH